MLSAPSTFALESKETQPCEEHNERSQLHEITEETGRSGGRCVKFVHAHRMRRMQAAPSKSARAESIKTVHSRHHTPISNQHPEMNRTMKTKTKMMAKGLASSALLSVLIGCATEKSPAQLKSSGTALVCPECKTVTLGPFPAFGDSPGKATATIEQHECAECRGILSLNSTKEWFRHECSVCKQGAFVCKPTATP
jgi:hypothetical protein